MEIREVKIEEYWPQIVKGTAEFGQIAVALNPEFNKLAQCIYAVLNESFVATASEFGVSRWEHILGITPATGATLDDRKAAVLTYLNIKTPYTWRVLKQMLVPILGGEDKFVLEYVNDEGKLVLHTDRLDDAMLATVDELLERVLPQNIEVVQYNQSIDIPWRDWTPGLTQVEYLESTGTQYINSEVNPGTYVNLDMTIAIINKLAAYDVFLGKSQTAEVGVSRMNIAATGNLLQTEFGWWPNTGVNITEYQKMHITFESEIGDFEGSKATVNDKDIISTLQLMYFQGDVSTLTNPLYFFARNTNGNPTAYSCCRIYSCRIKTKTATASFIPALDKLGTPGLYCPETKTFLTNLGTGDFLYPGAESAVATTDLDDKFYAKLTATGVRRLYHVPAGCNMTKDEYAAANGFKELVEPPAPLEGYWAPEWRETDTQLILEWVETEPPAEPEPMEVTENE